MTRRVVVAAVLVLAVVGIGLAVAITRPAPTPTSANSSIPSGSPVAAASRSPIPDPKHEVYGFVPYWEMDATIAAHLAATDLTTIGLFSVTSRKNGSLATAERGYRRMTGPIGEAIIAGAHDRGVRIEIVYTSFGTAKNAAFFTTVKAQDRTISELVGLAGELGVDGINVDVEQLPIEDIPAYGQFVGRLRAAVRVANPEGQVSVATTANLSGAGMAGSAARAGADRVFMMGYDYRVGASQPGASAPLGRRDGSEKTLAWSLDRYVDAGVPPEITILGLPLYGVTWPVTGPEIGAPSTGRGTVFVPRQNLDTLASPSASPELDTVEGVEVIALADGAAWKAIYYDTPATLTPKLALANSRGLAGAGFWAVGYERGLPDYTALINAFHAGRLPAAP